MKASPLGAFTPRSRANSGCARTQNHPTLALAPALRSAALEAEPSRRPLHGRLEPARRVDRRPSPLPERLGLLLFGDAVDRRRTRRPRGAPRGRAGRRAAPRAKARRRRRRPRRPHGPAAARSRPVEKVASSEHGGAGAERPPRLVVEPSVDLAGDLRRVGVAGQAYGLWNAEHRLALDVAAQPQRARRPPEPRRERARERAFARARKAADAHEPRRRRSREIRGRGRNSRAPSALARSRSAPPRRSPLAASTLARIAARRLMNRGSAESPASASGGSAAR